MNPRDLEKLCEDARRVVLSAVEFIRNERRTFQDKSVEYKGFNDLVSYVDKTSERILVDGLLPLVKDAGFITEEATMNTGMKEWSWVIDPLDGTTNFVHGLPCFCVSVGLLNAGKPVLGIVHECNLDECFYGWSGGGVWKNGEKVSVSAVGQLGRSLVATGFPYTDYSLMQPYMAVFDHCLRNTRGLRRLGSAAVDLAYVACGRFDCFYEYGLNPWDVTAGAFLVMEAGGGVSDFAGGDNYLFGREIIASAPGIHDEFLSVVKSKFNTA